MSKNIFNIVTAAVLAVGTISASADNSVATVPDGMMSLPIKHGVTNYLSLPLTNEATFTSTVATVTTNTITVDDTPAPFTTNLGLPTSPYFIKFLSGNETGRVMLVTANTASAITVDTTDHVSGAAVALTATSFNIQAGDTFEVFPGDTLASVFGAGTTNNPLVLTGGTTSTTSDAIALYTASNMPTYDYYFNTKAGYWEAFGSTVNADNTIIYPYSALAVARRVSHPDTSLVLAGRVTQVGAQTKVVGLVSVYSSSHYATDVTLSQLQFGSTWLQGSTVASADTLSVWNSTLGRFDVFYQKPDSTWRKYPDATTDQSSYTITAGTITAIAKRVSVSGANSFVQSTLPYTLE